MNATGREQNREQSESEAIHTSGNGSGLKLGEESPIFEKATGPRTELGKERASRNAVKHGVFSKVVVLKSESRGEFERLHKGLREALQPEGGLEELLVEKLATTAWRQRRLLLAESSEIQKCTEFVESDQRDRERAEAERVGKISRYDNEYGLIQGIQNPDVLARCLELLMGLSAEIKNSGFSAESDSPVLEKIYGDRDNNRLREDLYNSYQEWLGTSMLSEEEREREGYASPEQCRKNIVKEIEEEIRRLKRYQQARTSLESSRTQLEILRHNVPDAAGLDRLLRYEANLERIFDRTLSQLERLQRMRLGEPVLPKLEVRHSLS